MNGVQDGYFNSNDSRTEFGGVRTPTSHRDWMNPQGIGMNTSTGYHPVINVGAMDDFVESNYSIDATAKAFAILSDGLYSNKVLAKKGL